MCFLYHFIVLLQKKYCLKVCPQIADTGCGPSFDNPSACFCLAANELYQKKYGAKCSAKLCGLCTSAFRSGLHSLIAHQNHGLLFFLRRKHGILHEVQAQTIRFVPNHGQGQHKRLPNGKRSQLSPGVR